MFKISWTETESEDNNLFLLVWWEEGKHSQAELWRDLWREIDFNMQLAAKTHPGASLNFAAIVEKQNLALKAAKTFIHSGSWRFSTAFQPELS